MVTENEYPKYLERFLACSGNFYLWLLRQQKNESRSKANIV